MFGRERIYLEWCFIAATDLSGVFSDADFAEYVRTYSTGRGFSTGVAIRRTLGPSRHRWKDRGPELASNLALEALSIYRGATIGELKRNSGSKRKGENCMRRTPIRAAGSESQCIIKGSPQGSRRRLR